jgi:hypothetical protein
MNLRMFKESSYLEFWVIHSLEHDPRAGLAANGSGGPSDGREQTPLRVRGGVGTEGGRAPPEKRQRRHRNCWLVWSRGLRGWVFSLAGKVG